MPQRIRWPWRRRVATLRVDDLKGLREALCFAQSAMNHSDRNVSQHRGWSARIDALIAEIDRHRPLGSDGKHGDGRHTPTCGCAS